LRTRFDHLVVTAPPATISADGVELASTADTVVLVVRADETPTTLAQSLVKSVREQGSNPVGAVLIGVRDYGPTWLGGMLGSPNAQAR
jgi:Mrp family chromosome partitioning ATPase